MDDVPPHLPANTRKTLLLRLNAVAPEREVAWNEFHQIYAPVIRGFARKLGVRRDDLDDLVQGVLTGFFAASPEFRYDPSQGRFRGYLKTCVWRVFQRGVGKRLRIGGRSLDEVDPAELQVESTWNDVWEHEKLQRALQTVRERYSVREDKQRTFRAFEMTALLERPPQEVAAELQMEINSVNAAKSRISKAIKAELTQIDERTG